MTLFQGSLQKRPASRPGDIILSVNGKPVETDVSLPVMISAIQPGGSVELEIWRDRKLRKVTVGWSRTRNEV